MAVLKLKHKIPAFSLVEVLVAFVILLLIFFIAIQFFTNINLSGFDIQKINASNTLDDYIYQSRKNGNFSMARDSMNGWNLTREATPYEDADSLLQVTFTVYKKDSLATPLLSRTVLIDIHNHQPSVLNEQNIEP